MGGSVLWKPTTTGAVEGTEMAMKVAVIIAARKSWRRDHPLLQVSALASPLRFPRRPKREEEEEEEEEGQ
jgi:hypothetical protein